MLLVLLSWQMFPVGSVHLAHMQTECIVAPNLETNLLLLFTKICSLLSSVVEVTDSVDTWL